MRYFIQLSYLGTNYHGWQIQPNARTVQELLNQALSTILRTNIYVIGAGRTDAGVHAKEMYAHFDVESKIDEQALAYKLNRFLPNDVAIKRIIKVNNDAHARFDAVSRSYEYHITFAKNPFLVQLASLYTQKLNVVAMQHAAECLFDFEDFTAFSRSKTQTKTNLCNITKAVWQEVDQGLVFHISANRFLRNMVRAIVGTLVEVGNGRLSTQEFAQIIEGKERSKAGESAEAKGLFLTRVEYPNTILNG